MHLRSFFTFGFHIWKTRIHRKYQKNTYWNGVNHCFKIVFGVFNTNSLWYQEVCWSERRVSIIVQLSVAFTLIIGDHLELNRNHMNHVQHDSSRGPQLRNPVKVGSGLGLQRVYTMVTWLWGLTSTSKWGEEPVHHDRGFCFVISVDLEAKPGVI